MGELNLVTLIIIAVNVLISFKGFKDDSFFQKYKFNIADINRGAKYQILTSGFLHVNTTHLLVNMLTLYFFANSVIFFMVLYYIIDLLPVNKKSTNLYFSHFL